MTKVKITVMKLFGPEDVFGSNHDIRNLSGKLMTKCDLFKEGDEFIVETVMQMPDGFCGWAWRDIYKDLSVLYFDGHFHRVEKDMAYVSCTDGRKPVVFKLERIKEQMPRKG
ncbi:MAG TPA: TIGR04076 family protein [Candidatus Bathyarchaeia archaeon]|nr:TIGR04076 family protein [Candidatus Bathyarchaeia archaeon]